MARVTINPDPLRPSHIILTAQTRVGARDIRYSIEISDDCRHWSAADSASPPIVAMERSPLSPGIGTLRVTIDTSKSSARFFRIAVRTVDRR